MCEMRTARLHRPKWGSVLFVHARTHAASRGTRARTCTAHAGCLSTAAFLVAPLHRQGTGGSARDASCPFSPPVRQRRLRCGSGCASGQAELAMARERESSARMHSKFATRNERVRSLRVHGFIIAQLRDVRKCAVGVCLAVLVRCTKPSTARVNCPCCPLSGLSGLILICEGPPVRRRFAVVGR